MKVCAIVNPRSGSWKRREYARQDPARLVAQWLDSPLCARLSVQVMQQAKDGVVLTREALEQGYDTIVAVGGDGTINDVIQALCGERGPAQARLGLIPMGTANVLARILGLPLHAPAAAAEIVYAGHERRIDLGRADGQWFALMAGIGFDGAVTRAIDPIHKRAVGRLAYILTAARTALAFPLCRITLTLDDAAPREYNTFLVLIANGERYGGRYRLGEGVCLDDGRLDVFVCLRRGPLLTTLLIHGLYLLRDRLEHAPGIIRLHARHVRVSSDYTLPVQLDGDAASMTPISVEIVPGVLPILAPPTGL